MTQIENLLIETGSKQHLVRERALSQLEQKLEHATAENSGELVAEAERQGQEMMLSDEWEQRLGGLRLSRLLVASKAESAEFLQALYAACSRLLEDPEVRVRWAVGALLGELSHNYGTDVWEKMGERIMQSIEENYDRDDSEPSSKLPEENANVVQSLLAQSYATQRPGTGEMRHGTEGWKCLETSFRALENIMKGCGESFRSILSEEIFDLIVKSSKHPNRFVREICQFVFGTICGMLSEEELRQKYVMLASNLGFGLSDNWSQVRYAASVSARTFVLASKNFHDNVLPLILPQMCLNRYYVAEGVRVYSQETWKLAVGDQGKEWVARCINNVVSYYVEQSNANNHAVREASCACIAELMAKVDRTAVAPHVQRLLTCLLTCFRDASWPVRDAACLASGRCVLAFPEESKIILEKLYGLWFAHLEENIFSVREDTAVALGNAARAYGQDAINRIVEKLHIMLPKAKDQKPDSKALANLENTTTFGVAAERAKRANDESIHTDQTMFSCGSLAPKLKRGADCCGDYGLNRPAEPWETSDGAIYMVRELSMVSPASVLEFVPVLADLASLTHFTHCLTLHETLWNCLPIIAGNLGKKEFKKHLELFLDPLFKDLCCGHRLCEAAAGKCIVKLRDLIGPGIFAGRLNEQQLQIMNTCQDTSQ